jgi:hypothetical protein
VSLIVFVLASKCVNECVLEKQINVLRTILEAEVLSDAPEFNCSLSTVNEHVYLGCRISSLGRR